MAPLRVFALLGCLAAQESDPWVRPPSEQQRKDTPGLVHETFESGVMKTRVGYSVVLPAGYETGEKRYPVVYWLHGGGGNESSSLFTAKAFRELAQAGKIAPVLLVYPNGFRSGYMDHHDGKVMIESLIIKELIPRIDATYRTVASRSGRALHGFSMGATGALKFAMKYPDRFASSVAYGGGEVDLEKTRDPFIVRILQANLNGDPDLIRRNNTYHYLETNGEAVRKNGIRFLLICGEEDRWKESAQVFHRDLLDRKLSSELVLVPNARHDLRALTAAEGERAALFQDEIFRRAPPGK